jgi:hypothetical protein
MKNVWFFIASFFLGAVACLAQNEHVSIEKLFLLSFIFAIVAIILKLALASPIRRAVKRMYRRRERIHYRRQPPIKKMDNS